VPVLRQLFSSNDNTITQTDIVMLLTPRIIRTTEITEEDLKPIYIGSQQNLGVGGPPALIAAAPEAAPAPAAPQAGIAPGQILGTTPAGVTIAAPPGSTPVPGTVVVPPAPPAQPPAPPAVPPAAPPTVQPPPPDAAAAPAPAIAPPSPPAATAPPPTTTPGVGLAQVILTPPGATFRVGGGPYTVPISITNASRVSTLALTLTFDPALLRVRSVQEGSFMRAGGVNAQFTQNLASPGRVDLTITRAADQTGASGTGLLGAILFEPIGAGSATLSLSGAATGPGNTPMGLQFRPVTITIQP
jgi:hypothetical protein